MRHALYLGLSLSCAAAAAQPPYYPPLSGTVWDTVGIQSLGWSSGPLDSLRTYLDTGSTRAFVVLKDGRIAIEWYFGTFTRDSVWYWASAGKTITATVVGIAQQEGYLSLSDRTSDHIGRWTSCPLDKENLITVWHQLTMSSGLDDGVADPYCTDPGCLQYAADAGTRWAYHNAPYTLLDTVVSAATGQNYNLYVSNRLASRIGMAGVFVKSGYNNVYISSARSMARFGLLIQSRGVWDTDTIVTDTSYYRAMVTRSQSLNESYGYLWWLNGQASFMVPGPQLRLPGMWCPNAPPDMFAALGKDGQIINVVPSMGLVVVRMGESPDQSPVPLTFNNEIWRYLTASMGSNATVRGPVRDSRPVAAACHLVIWGAGQQPAAVVWDLHGRRVDMPAPAMNKRRMVVRVAR